MFPLLPLVSVIFLCLALEFQSLLALSGTLMRKTRNYEKRLQAIYEAESRLLYYLGGVGVDSVKTRQAGPWLEISSQAGKWGVVKVLAGSRSGFLSSRERRNRVEAFRSLLHQEILMGKQLKIKSGNRRLLGPAQDVSLEVENGDLLIDFWGNSSVCNFKTSGVLTLRGSATYDTLRLYSVGPMLIEGQVKIKWLEAFSVEQVEISGNVEFSGAVAANNGVNLNHHAKAAFPSSLLSVNGMVNYSDKNVSDSLLNPVFEDVPQTLLIPWGWSLL